MLENSKSPKDFGPVWLEHSKSARGAQVDYGRWMVNTLWLMHSGAIAGLVSKWSGGPFLKPYSIAIFAVGILMAFGAAAAAWLNFSIANDFYNRYLLAGDRWFDFNGKPHDRWLLGTTIAAVVSIILSILCLIAGVVVTLISV